MREGWGEGSEGMGTVGLPNMGKLTSGAGLAAQHFCHSHHHNTLPCCPACCRSVQEREAEYHRARARIFGDAGGPEGYGPVMGSPGGVPPPPPGRGGPLNGGVGHGGPGGGGMMAGGMPTPFGGMMGHMAPQQMGGAGMYGGASGMGRPGMPGPGGMSPYGAPPSSPYGAAAGGHVAPYGASPGAYSAGPAGGYGGGYGGGGGGGGPRPTKAQLRNKEADMADPDFRRGRCG